MKTEYSQALTGSTSGPRSADFSAGADPGISPGRAAAALRLRNRCAWWDELELATGFPEPDFARMHRRMNVDKLGHVAREIYFLVREATRRWYLDVEASELAGEPVLKRYDGIWATQGDLALKYEVHPDTIARALKELITVDVLEDATPVYFENNERLQRHTKRKNSRRANAYVIKATGTGQVPHPYTKPPPERVDKRRVSTAPRTAKCGSNSGSLISGSDFRTINHVTNSSPDARARGARRGEQLSAFDLIRDELGLGAQQVTSAASPRLVSEPEPSSLGKGRAQAVPFDVDANVASMRRLGWTDQQIETWLRARLAAQPWTGLVDEEGPLDDVSMRERLAQHKRLGGGAR